jgi:hypothetical protein
MSSNAKGKKDTLMSHSLSSNTLLNATRFSHNSVQGHHHSIMGVERYADEGVTRWSMSVGCLIDPDSCASRYNRSAVHKRPILGTGILIGGRGNTLIISDLHLPYQHKDAFDFLWALQEEFQFQRVLNVGDLYDHHRGSYHESEPDALGEEEEFYAARDAAYILQEMFPEMVITSGNHDNIPQRKLKSVGLPTSLLSDYNKMYDTAETWEWTDRYWFDSWGAYPMVVPMILNKRGRWDKHIPRLK